MSDVGELGTSHSLPKEGRDVLTQLVAVRGHKTTGAEKPAPGGPAWNCSLNTENKLLVRKGEEGMSRLGVWD